jgi:hypothetical protein
MPETQMTYSEVAARVTLEVSNYELEGNNSHDLDDGALEKTIKYFWENGYRTDEDYESMSGNDETSDRNMIYFAYDVLKYMSD